MPSERDISQSEFMTPFGFKGLRSIIEPLKKVLRQLMMILRPNRSSLETFLFISQKKLSAFK